MKLRSWSSRAVFSAAICAASTFLYAGCSDDDPAPADATDAGNDGLTPTQDTGPAPDGGGTDGPEACPDTPFDCSATAGDAGVDDAGVDAGSNSTAPENSVPINLRCTGLYSCWSTKKVATTTHREYAPGFVLWSDHAEKTRWLVLPPGGKIDTGGAVGNPDGGTVDEWVLPVGTMVYKEFKLSGKRVETRRIWKAAEGKTVYSVWRWSADESTATLTYAGGVIPNPVVANHVYEIPATNACANCHDGHRDKFLSIDAWSMATPNAKGVTLATLVAEGALTWPYPTSFAVPQDDTGKFDLAVGFYYNNCGFCHKPGRPGGGSGLHLYLPVAAALPGGSAGLPTGLPDGGAGIVAANTPVYTTAVGIAHTNELGGQFPLATHKRITKGNPDLSVVHARDSLRDPDGGTIVPGQMPNVLTRTTDPVGVPAAKAWITALPP